MLVLTRKESQRILIGNDITVTVVRLASGNVRIGIDAPKDVPVHREEVVQMKRCEQWLNALTQEVPSLEAAVPVA